ncbi:hypothetical protein [Armatimonas sp.]|uniref:hypothetical protein n=1 Tax=Armatimonas sp. TaxID=1872638 RepID=UPI00375000C6
MSKKIDGVQPGCVKQIIGGICTVIVIVLFNLVLNGGLVGCQKLLHLNQYRELDDVKNKIKSEEILLSQEKNKLEERNHDIDVIEKELDPLDLNIKEMKKKYILN